MAGPDTLEVNSSTLADFKSAPAAVIDFTATWCGPCQVLGPLVDKLASEFKDTVKIGKCDIDGNQEIAAEFGIMAVPTLVFFKNGEIVDQANGLPEDDFRSRIKKLTE